MLEVAAAARVAGADGGWVSEVCPPVTVTVTAADVVLPPSASLATAVSKYVPAGTDEKEAANGAVVLEPTSVAPA